MSEESTEFTDDIITLRGEKITVKNGYVPHINLLFYSENPRIYSQVWKDDEEPSQDVIYGLLSKTENVRENLVPSIRHNGGLIEPVLVRQNVVLEGNSRLAAYRLLYAEDKQKWRNIRVRVLPDEVTESQIFSLLGEYHIVGKKDWSPYEQAGYLWRRFKIHNVDEDDLKNEVGLSKQRIRHLIHVYTFMMEHEERDPAKWSYYDELLKRFDDARELYPQFDEIVVEKIRNGEIKRAVDLRDELPLIVKAGNRTLKKFIEGRTDFEEAVEEAKFKGAGNSTKNKLENFRQWLGDQERDEDFNHANQEEKHSIKFQLQKIHDRTDQLLKKHFKNS